MLMLVMIFSAPILYMKYIYFITNQYEKLQ